MKHLNTSRRISRVFGGLVLVLAMVLVACGTDSDEPDPTVTAEVGQEAQPTVPPLESTPDTSVSEDEITVLEPQVIATPRAATPDVVEVVDESDTEQDDPVASPQATPQELTSDAATPDDGLSDEDVAVADDDQVPDATPASKTDEDSEAPSEAAAGESTPEPTVRARTGNETFDHPGDGTGGSGMPGELTSDDETEEVTEGTPVASPVAQLTITGCEVPDVPGFLGDSNSFALTADVNFRSGPGIDCDPVFEDALGEGQVVEVLGGPVTQADDGSEWVQIEIDGEPGWITTEFIEPTE